MMAPSTGSQGHGGGGTTVPRLVAGAHTRHRGQALVTGGLGWGGQPQTRRGLLLTSRGFFSQGQPSSCRSRGG